MPKLKASAIPQAPIVWPTFSDLEIEAVKERFNAYPQAVLDGKLVVNKWVYAAVKRHERDLQRGDIQLDWQEIARFLWHCDRCKLIDEWVGQPLVLPGWQVFFFGSLVGWKWTADNRRRFKLCLLQVARGAGKTTGAGVWALYELLRTQGAMGYAIANSEDQAGICLDNMKKVLQQISSGEHDLESRIDHIKSSDINLVRSCMFRVLPALERSLDGLNPSFWIADEAAEFQGRFLTKLLTTGAKRKESTGLIITTPGTSYESQYGELVKALHGILLEEGEDDSFFGCLYGLDDKDDVADERGWIKANPGLEYGQPTVDSLRRTWVRMKTSPITRSEWTRYHCSRIDENAGGFLDMSFCTTLKDFDESSLLGQTAYAALDLSKSGDMTCLMIGVPMGDGRIYLKGQYFWPGERIQERELNYRIPLRAWAAEGKIAIHPGAEINYEEIEKAVVDACNKWSIRRVVYDAWGSHLLAGNLVKRGVPMESYRQNISHFAPAMQLFMNLWNGRKIVFSESDPILRKSFASTHAAEDQSGNLRPVKQAGNRYTIIDPTVCALMLVHSWGGTPGSAYEEEAAEAAANNQAFRKGFR